MQATVHRFDSTTGSGALIDDEGTVHTFSAAAFAQSGLRHLRVGQRLHADRDDNGQIISLRLGTINQSRSAASDR